MQELDSILSTRKRRQNVQTIAIAKLHGTLGTRAVDQESTALEDLGEAQTAGGQARAFSGGALHDMRQQTVQWTGPLHGFLIHTARCSCRGKVPHGDHGIHPSHRARQPNGEGWPAKAREYGGGMPEAPENATENAAANSRTTLTHVREDGSAHMVDVTAKQETTRTAVATGTLRTRPDVIEMIFNADLPKGDALPVARVAGIMGAKKTPEIIPLCHPLPLGKITVDFERTEDSVIINASVKTRGVTGVEMEALTAVTTAALTVYDMIKAVDKHAEITDVKVLAKSGGKSGDWSV